MIKYDNLWKNMIDRSNISRDQVLLQEGLPAPPYGDAVFLSWHSLCSSWNQIISLPMPPLVDD